MLHSFLRKKVRAVSGSNTLRNLVSLQCLMITFMQTPVLADPVDLASSKATVQAQVPSSASHPATITVGGQAMTVTNGALLTPAENVALQQVLTTGHQALLINAAGAAAGGGFLVNNVASSGSIVVPQNVNAYANFSGSNSLNIAGSLSNSGNVYLFSANNAIQSGTLSTQSIVNNSSGLISSLMPATASSFLSTNLLPNIGSLVSNFSFTLQAVQSITNYGAITSAGNLTMVAPQIVNTIATPAVSPVIQALGNLNIVSPNIINSGLMSSIAGNVNFTQDLVEKLNITNTGGIIQALSGNINITSLNSDINLLGGSLVAQQLGVNSGCGNMNIDVDAIGGQLNITGANLGVVVEKSGLTLGTITATADPVISAQNIIFSNSVAGTGADLVFVSAGDITTNTNGLSFTNIGAGKLWFLAGVLQDQVTKNYTVLSPNGGSIDFKTHPIAALGTAGGDIALTANAGSFSTGTINLPAITVTTNGGNFTAIAGSANTLQSINIGDVDTSKGANSNGKIVIQSATPVVDVVNNTLNAGAAALGNVTVGNLTAYAADMTISSAGNLSISSINNTPAAGGNTQANIKINAVNLLAGNIVANGGPGGGGDGSNIVITTTSSSPFALGGATSNGFTGAGTVISARGGATGGNGGKVSIVSSSDLNVGNLSLVDGSGGSIDVRQGAATGGNGGTISLTSAGGAVNVTTTNSNSYLFASGATAGGAGQSISGGEIDISGRLLRINGTQALSLLVDGSGTGKGGTVKVTTTDSTSDLSVSNSLGSMLISAKGGNDVTSTSADGGIVSVTGGRNLFIDPSAITAAPQATGKGQTLAFSATAGDLTVVSGLNANGNTNAGGGDITLSAKNNVIVNGGISSVGFGIGNGGKLTTSNASLVSINGNIDLTGGITSGAGGAVLANNGTFYVNGNITAAAGAGSTGKGGSITITESSAAGFLLGPGAAGNGVNGIVDVSGGSGAGSSGGGSISVTASNGAITVNNTGNLGLSAGLGAGSTLVLSAKSTLKINSGNINVNAGGNNGQGGSVTLTGQTVYLNGSISANAIGTGSGNNNSVSITTTSANQVFILGPAATTNGITGSIQANGGGTSGNGGTINISAGTGGLTVSDPALMSAAASSGTVGGRGGTIGLISAGALTFSQGGILNVSGHGNGGTAGGGSLSLHGNTINVLGSLPLTLSASGSSTAGAVGDGGQVTIQQDASSQGIGVGNSPGNFQIDANSAATDGKGGTVTIQAGQDVNINSLFLSVNSTGNGTGGSVTVKAGVGSTGQAFISGNLLANGSGTGGGGLITIEENTASDFQVDPGAAISGITGSMQVNAGAKGGASVGKIAITNNLGGIKVVNTAAFVLTGTNSANASVGGELDLTASKGTISIQNGTISVQGYGTGAALANGGKIVIAADSIAALGPAAVVLNTSGAANGNGGSIKLSSNGSVTVGILPGQFQAISTGGSAGSVTGDGGSFTVNVGLLKSGQSINVDPAGININPVGSNGKGGTIELELSAGNVGSILVTGSLSANGVGQGDGGIIRVFGNSSTDLDIGLAGASMGVQGSLTANGGNAGGGGQVSVAQLGIAGGGVTLWSTNSISINAGTKLALGTPSDLGNGGTINLDGGLAGNVTIKNVNLGSNLLTASANSATDSANAGTITLNGASVLTQGTVPLELRAQSFNTTGIQQKGNGGIISITSTKSTNNIYIGSQLGVPNNAQFVINCAPLATGGDGGNVTIHAGGNLIVDVPLTATIPSTGLAATADSNVGQFAFGNGASYSLIAGANGAPASLIVTGNLNANGGLGGNGSGGAITLQSTTTVFVNGSILAASASKAGGGVVISSHAAANTVFNQDSTEKVNGITGSIDVNAQGGTAGGSFTINADLGGIRIGDPTKINLKGGATAGGSLTLNTSGILTLTPGGANGQTGFDTDTLGGTYGKMSISADSISVSQITIPANTQWQTFYFSNTSVGIVTTGKSGSLFVGTPILAGALTQNLYVDNAKFTVSAGQNITITFGTKQIVSQPSGGGFISGTSGVDIRQGITSPSGDGSHVSLTAGTGGVGMINVFGNIDASGASTIGKGSAFSGAGGVVTLTMASAQAFVIGDNSSGNGISGFIAANGAFGGFGTAPNGGSITITNTIGDIQFAPGALVTANGGVSNFYASPGLAGSGGTITLKAANGSITANGGTVQANGLNGTTSVAGQVGLGVGLPNVAAGGIGGSNGGTIVFTSQNTLSVNPILDIQANGSAGGSGGSITLTSTAAAGNPINVGPGALTLSATGGQAANVLNITGDIAIGSFVISNVSNMTGIRPGNQISGAGLNPGTTITQILGPNSVQVDQAATATAAGLALTDLVPVSQFGSGGKIIVNLSGPLNIVAGGINNQPLGANGNGGTYNLTVNTVGTLLAPVNLDASGVGYGSGGSVILNNALNVAVVGNVTANAGLVYGNGGSISVNAAGGQFLISAVGAAPSNGILGILQAKGTGVGSITATGGSVTVNNLGNGGILVDSSANIDVSVTGGGSGGSFSLLTQGAININGGTISASASGAGQYKGGNISIQGSQIIFTSAKGAGTTLNANGAGTGDGGSIVLTASAAGAPISIGDTSALANQVALLANSGGGGGNGGNITVSNGDAITVNDASFIQVSSAGGTGGKIVLAAGTATKASLNINAGSLNANGAGTGDGGTILLTASGAFTDAFPILANAGTNGNGGNIQVSFNNNAAVNFGTLQAQGGSGASGGNGGTLSIINQGTGTLTFNPNPAVISVAAGAAGGAGGSISLSNANGQIAFTGSGTLDVSAAGAGVNYGGGQITISAASISIPANKLLQLNANAVGAGSGGNITVAATGVGSSLTFDNLSGISVRATGGSPASIAGNGGSFSATAGGNIILGNPNCVSCMTLIPTGYNGSGGKLSLLAGTATGGGNVTVTGNLPSLNGVGSGNGGSVILSAGTALLLGTVNITGSITANGGANGSGGSVTIFSNSNAANGITGDITVQGGGVGGDGGAINITNVNVGKLDLSGINLLANAVGAGNGGSIIVSAAGQLITNGQYIIASAAKGGAFAGGNIQITAGSLSNSNAGASTTILAQGSGAGGGSITLVSQSASQDINLSAAGSAFTLDASETLAGSGGLVSVSSGRNIIVANASNINVSAAGANASGGSILLLAGTGGSGSINVQAGNLSLNGIGTGNGGTANLAAANDLFVGGSINATGGTSGLGGRVLLSFTASSDFVVGVLAPSGVKGVIDASGGTASGNGGDITIVNNAGNQDMIFVPGTLLVTTNLGNGGNVTLKNAGGVIDLSAFGSINANAAGLGTGGNININAARLFPSIGSIQLSANGAGTGNAGNISLTASALGSNVVLDDANGFKVTLLGGAGGGDGGTLNVTAGAYVIIGPASCGNCLQIGPQAIGNGGNIILRAGTAGTGDITSSISLSASGSGSGSGGIIQLSAGTAANSGNVSINGNLSSNGGNNAAPGNGGSAGSISISVNSDTELRLGNLAPTGNNFIAGSISATGGNASAGSGGSGGVITISNLGASSGSPAPLTGGLTMAGASITANGGTNSGGTGGFGGTITLNAPLASFGLISGSITANGSGTGSANGGSIQIKAFSFNNNNSVSAVLVNASGTDTGNGGTVNVSASFSGFPPGTQAPGNRYQLTLGPNSGNMRITDTSGANGGNGGNVTVSIGDNLIIDNSGALKGLIAAPLGVNGNGANLNLTGGAFNCFASLTVTGDLNASGVGTGLAGNAILTGGNNVYIKGNVFANAGSGSGGTITISTASLTQFNVGLTANTTLNGVTGNITADGGGPAGNGGSIALSNLGAGGVGFSGSLVSAMGTSGATGGVGGNVQITSLGGTATFSGGTIDVSGGGGSNGAFNGGTIFLHESQLALTALGATPTTFNANGAQSGNAGTISLQIDTSGSLAVRAGQTDAVIISATGGANGGNGGLVTIKVPGNITIFTNAFSVAPGAAGSGNGAIVNLSAGSGASGLGNVLIQGNLNVSASTTGSGVGGTLNIQESSNNPFVFGNGATVNGVSGNPLLFTADGGKTGGNGGFITVNNTGSGGFTFASGTISASGVAGSGGTITLTAGTGPVVFGASTINANGGGVGGVYSGGTVTISGTGVSNIALAGPTFLSANGSDLGAGGSVLLNFGSVANSNISLGTGVGQEFISAQGGNNALATNADGGTISVSTGGNIAVSALQFSGTYASGSNLINVLNTSGLSKGQVITGAGIAANTTITAIAGNTLTISNNTTAAGNNATVTTDSAGLAVLPGAAGSGNGGNIKLSAGSSNAGSLSITGNLNASGTGASGNGGAISITTSGSATILGNLSANGSDTVPIASTFGNAGTITVKASSSITLGGSINADGGANGGVGGAIDIQTPSSTLTLNTASISASAKSLALANGVFNGGTISLSASAAVFPASSPFTLTATGTGVGSGGSVTFVTSGAGSSVTVGNANGQLQIIATSGANGGNGGSAKVTAGNSLVVAPSGINVSPLGSLGVGGSISLGAGSGGLLVNGALSSTGPTGGGTLILSSSSSIKTTAGLNVNATSAVNGGAGGTITVTDGASGSILIAGNVTANGAGNGPGGTITFNIADSGNFVVNAGGTSGVTGTVSATVGAGATGGGGGTVVFNDSGTGMITLSGASVASAVNIAPGSVTGNGGTLNLLIPNGILVIPTNPAGSISVNGNGSGNGGTIAISTKNAITLGTAIGQYTLSASAGAFGGAGGQINLNSGAGITVASAGAVLVNATNGDGGTIKMTAGTNIQVTGSLDAKSVGSGVGGEVNLQAPNGVVVNGSITVNSSGAASSPILNPVPFPKVILKATNGGVFVGGQINANGGIGIGGRVEILENLAVPFVVGATATQFGGGVLGPITAGSGLPNATVHGIFITNTAGGLTIDSSQIKMNSVGGIIKFTATGVLSMSGGLLAAPSGGQISLSANSLAVTGGTPLILRANGAANSNTGLNINLSSGGLTIDNTGNAVSIDTSAVVFSGGNANITVKGPVQINNDSGPNKSINTSGPSGNGNFSLDAGVGAISIDANGLHNDGLVNGGQIVLSGNGIYNSGSLTANAGPGGAGGPITVTTTSGLPILVGAAPVVGVSQAIVGLGAQLSSTGGTSAGGQITISATVAGSLTFSNMAALNVSGNNAGGSLIVTAPLATINLTAGTLSTSGTTDSGDINMSAAKITAVGGLAILRADAGAAAGHGGNITLTSTVGALSLGSAGTAIEVVARGSSLGGAGGAAKLVAAGGITLGAGGIDVSVLGNNGSGGKIDLSVSGGSTLQLASLTANGVGTGDGGTINLTTGTGGFVRIVGALNANAGVNGLGGTVNISSGGAGAFQLGTPLGAGVAGVSGAINVNGGSNSGDGGTVNLTSLSATGGFVISSTAVINASANGSGNGGKITFKNTSGTFAVAGGTFNANAAGATNAKGGTISIDSTSIVAAAAGFGNNALNINANGVNKGAGGTITVKASAAATLTIGNTAAGMLNLFAEDGGTVSLSSGGDLLINTPALNTVRLGSTAPTVNLTSANGNITLVGVGVGNPASVLNVSSPFGGNLNITVNGGALIENNGATINAANLSIGGTGSVGSGGNPFVITANPFNLNITSSATFTSPTSVVLGNIKAANFTLTAGAAPSAQIGNITTTGTIQVQNLNLTANNDGSIAIQSPVSASSNISLTATGAGTIIQAGGSLTSASLSLVTNTGNIGSPTAPITFNAGSVSTKTNASAYLNSIGAAPVSISGPGAGAGLGSVYNLVSNSNITISSPISADLINISGNPALNVSISNLSTVTAGTQVNLTTTGTGSLSSTIAGLVSGPTVILATGSAGGAIGSAGSPFAVAAGNLTAGNQVAGSVNGVFLSNSAAVSSLTSIQTNGAFSITNTNPNATITSGPVSAASISMTGASNTNTSYTIGSNLTAANGVITISATGTGNILDPRGVGVLTGSNITLTGTNIGANLGNFVSFNSANPLVPVNLSVTATGNAFVINTGNESVNLIKAVAGAAGTFFYSSAGGSTGDLNLNTAMSGNAIFFKAGGTLFLNSNITGTGLNSVVGLSGGNNNQGNPLLPSAILQGPNTSIVANRVLLYSARSGNIINGNIGSVSSPIVISPPTGVSTNELFVITAGDVFINDKGSVVLTTYRVNNMTLTLNPPFGVVPTLTTSNDLTVTQNLTLNNIGNLVNNAPNVISANVININSVNNASMTISGNGTISNTGVGVTNLNLTGSFPNGQLLIFAGNQTFNGLTNLNAIQAGQAVQINAGVTVTANGLFNLNTSTFQNNGNPIAGPGPVSLNAQPGAPSSPTMSSNGDLIITSNFTFNGNSLVLIAQGNIIAGQGLFSINLGSFNRSGGNLSIIAGEGFTTDAVGQMTLTGPSAQGGSVILQNVSLNTSTFAAGSKGGNVTVIANAGSINNGLIHVGSVNTNGNLAGGSIVMIGQGGVLSDQAITSTGITAGSVLLSGSAPTIVGGPVIVYNNVLSGGAFAALAPTAGAGAAIYVNGGINASSNNGAGANVTLNSDSNISVLNFGGINTSGPTGAGSVLINAGLPMNSLSGAVSIAGGINAGAGNIFGAGARPGGIGGVVSVQAPNYIYIGGNLISSGGTTFGTGAGGAGGAITLSTSNLNANGLYTGSIFVQGAVDARGGSSSGFGSVANGGAAGAISISGGTIGVSGFSSGVGSVSVDARGGAHGNAGGVNGADAAVTLTTSATQTIPLNLDLTVGTAQLTNSSLGVIAIPGGLFTVGNFQIVNGVVGNIAGNTGLANPIVTASMINGGTGRVYNSFTLNNVQISVTSVANSNQININGTPTNIAVDNGAGVRTVVTPSAALALYQSSRSVGSQTVSLNASSQATAGGSISTVDYDFSQTFTAFNLQIAGGGPVSVFDFNVSGARPALYLSGSNSTIGEALNFVTAGATPMIDYNFAGLNVTGAGKVTASNTSTLILTGAGMNINNQGLISAGNILMANSSGNGITFNQTNGGTIQGAAGAVRPAILVDVGMGSFLNFNFNSIASNFNLPVVLSTTPIAGVYKSLAYSYYRSPFQSVTLGFGLSTPLNAAGTAIVGGDTGGLPQSLTINSNAAVFSSPPTILQIGDSTGVLSASPNLVAVSSVSINAQGPVLIDNPSPLTALVATNVAATGNFSSISINATKGITIGSGGVAVTPQVTISSGGGANIMSGGNLLLQNQSSITAGNFLSINLNSQTATVTLTNASITAGVLTGAPPVGNIPFSAVTKSGGINFSSFSTGAINITNSNITVNGGSLMWNSGPSPINISGTLQANGGSIGVFSQGAMTFNPASTILARTLSGGSGGVNISVGSFSSNGLNLTATQGITLSSNGLFIDNGGSNISSTGGSIFLSGFNQSLLGTNAISIGASTLSSAFQVSIFANGANGSIAMAPGSNISAANSSIFINSPLNIVHAGTMNAKTGLTVNGGFNASITENGLLTVSNGTANFSAANLTSGAGSSIAASNGITVNGSFSGVVNLTGIMSSTAGSITVNSGTLTINPGSSISGATGVTLNANTGNITINGGAGALQTNLTAGIYIGPPVCCSTITNANVGKAGVLAITTQKAIAIGDWVNMTSTSGNINITANGTGGITLGGNNTWQANGGNIIVLTNGVIAQNLAVSGNVFRASAIGNATFSTGSGIEFSAGSTVSRLFQAVPPGPPFTAFGAQVLGTNVNGATALNLSMGGSVNLTTNATPTTMTLQGGGGIVMDSTGALNTVRMDGATFRVDGFKPIAYSYSVAPAASIIVDDDANGSIQKLADLFIRGCSSTQALTAQQSASAGKDARGGHGVNITFESGELVMHPVFDTTIKARFAEIKARKGAIVAINQDQSMLRVANCGEMGNVSMTISGKELVLASGEEIIVSKKAIAESEKNRADGVGRRDFRSYHFPGNLHVMSCEFSIFSLLASAEHLHPLRHPVSRTEKTLYERIMKTAASVHTVTQRHGIYQSVPKSVPALQPSRFADGGALTPVSYKQ